MSRRCNIGIFEFHIFPFITDHLFFGCISENIGFGFLYVCLFPYWFSWGSVLFNTG